MTPCFVYVIASSYGHVKVGISRNPKGRLADLQRGFPHKLSLIRVFARPHGDAGWVERTSHRLLHEYRQQRTEWFKVPVADAIVAVEKAARAGDARSIKLLPKPVVAMDRAGREKANRDALEWAKKNPGALAQQIRKWSEL